MLQVLLLIHLIIALSLVFVILIQRSEGGGLGIGGGGGGMMSARGVASALTRVTAILAAAFISLSLVLTVLAGGRDEASSVTDVLVEDLDDSGFPAIALPSGAGVGADDAAEGDDSEEDDGGNGDGGSN